MSDEFKYIHPCTYEAAYEVASNLRPEDLSECVEGHGVLPTIDLPLACSRGFSVYFTAPDGRTAGMGGIEDDGRIWMLCTPVIHDYPVSFARFAKKFINSRTEKILYNVVDKRNTAHLRLLKFLGFKFIREIPFGPNNLPFIEFIKCALPQPQ
jgi:hypothetical protein